MDTKVLSIELKSDVLSSSDKQKNDAMLQEFEAEIKKIKGENPGCKATWMQSSASSVAGAFTRITGVIE